MRERGRREPEVFGLSFLDAICCGFGAIVLLLVITKTAEPTIAATRGTGLENLADALAAESEDLDERKESLEQELARSRERLAELRTRVARLEPGAAKARAEHAAARLESRAAEAIEHELASAKQELTEEMKRLYASGRRPAAGVVGGIPIDSEYIVFVIDTSGSMHRFAWPAVVRTLTETLDVYPKVRGLQVMNDMGDYMFTQYSGQWIPDTPGRRKAIVERLATWQPFSNSSPVEGIERAIRAFGNADRPLSIYVFGDEFTGGSAEAVLTAVRRMNPRDASGRPRVRIHAVGFPTQISGGGIQPTGIRFANLMRRLCAENGGTFVGLKSRGGG